MNCAWKELLGILPQRIRSDVDRLGRKDLQELRLRLGRPPELVLKRGPCNLTGPVTSEELTFVINSASRYSPWAAETAARGYITAPGGHRIGICGQAVVAEGTVRGIRRPTSLNIRVARDISGVGDGIPLRGNLLILGPPGSGKTTLLRDLCRRLGEHETLTVVDERMELFPEALPGGGRMDVLTGCGKAAGIEMALRTMGPAWIAVDEITAASDCTALLSAGWCGVRLIATAHAASVRDLKSRELYGPLWNTGLFTDLVILDRDQRWHMERVVGRCSGSLAPV